MPSPFPGMDPYLEAPPIWAGVHHRLISAIEQALNRLLPEPFVAEIEQYVSVQEASEEEEFFSRRNPDVFVPEANGVHRPKRSESAGAAAVLSPPTNRVRLATGAAVKHRRILITTTGDEPRQVLTAIEILSPSNKTAGRDREAYLAKRAECLGSGTNLVELDLLRAGDRLPMGKPRPAVTDYYAIVSAADERPEADVWAFGLRDPLPVLPIPLRPPLDPVPLDLRACLDRVYEDGAFDRKLRYDRPADPPLNTRDAEWAAGLFAKPKKRKGGK